MQTESFATIIQKCLNSSNTKYPPPKFFAQHEQITITVNSYRYDVSTISGNQWLCNLKHVLASFLIEILDMNITICP